MWRSSRILAVALAAAIAGTGCEPAPAPAGRAFDGVFPARAGGALQVPALPIRVEDRSGLVQAAAFVNDPILQGIGAVPDRPNAIAVGWTGGACDHRVAVTIEGVAAAVRVAIRTEIADGACRAIGIPRSIELQFREAIDPTTVSMSIAP